MNEFQRSDLARYDGLTVSILSTHRHAISEKITSYIVRDDQGEVFAVRPEELHSLEKPEVKEMRPISEVVNLFTRQPMSRRTVLK